MSEQAKVYYQDRAERLNIDVVPPILDGQPRLLYVGSMPLHAPWARPFPEAVDGVQQRYGEALASVGDFALRCAGSEPTDAEFQSEAALYQQEQHVNSMVRSMIALPEAPEAAATVVTIEAVPDSEITIDEARIALRTCPWRVAPEYEDKTVFLKTSAVLFAAQEAYVTKAFSFIYRDLLLQPDTPVYRAVMCAPKMSKTSNANVRHEIMSTLVRSALDVWGINK